jgi:hypothetical protein
MPYVHDLLGLFLLFSRIIKLNYANYCLVALHPTIIKRNSNPYTQRRIYA